MGNWLMFYSTISKKDLLRKSNIVEPQVIGDVLSFLLLIVNVTENDGKVVCVKYKRPHYQPVSRILFECFGNCHKEQLG